MLELMVRKEFRCQGCILNLGSQDDHDCCMMPADELDEQALQGVDARLFKCLTCLALKCWCEEYNMASFTHQRLLSLMNNVIKPVSVEPDLDAVDQTKKKSVKKVIAEIMTTQQQPAVAAEKV